MRPAPERKRGDRPGSILAFRKVELAAETVDFERVVIELGQAAEALYATGLLLAHDGHTIGSEAVVLLSREIRRRVEALHRLTEQREGAADA